MEGSYRDSDVCQMVLSIVSVLNHNYSIIVDPPLEKQNGDSIQRTLA